MLKHGITQRAVAAHNAEVKQVGSNEKPWDKSKTSGNYKLKLGVKVDKDPTRHLSNGRKDQGR